MIRTRSISVSILLVVALLISLQSDARAQSTAVIDFEGLTEGAIVASVSSGNGVSGEIVDGVIHVYGENPSPWITTNAAMIFDGTCSPGGTPADCSGGDDDLYHPDWGNMLIVSEDLDSTDPDDSDLAGTHFAFIYTDWGPGSVKVDSFGVQDVEEEENTEDALAYFYDCDIRDVVNCPWQTAFFNTVDIPETGDGESMLVPVGYSGVVSMIIDLEGSGAIDNVHITTEPTAVELKSFKISAIDEVLVKVDWETTTEIDNFGFNLYRSQGRSSAQAELIHFEPAAGGLGGHHYEYTDILPANGQWYYWLSDVDTNGKETFHSNGFATVSTGVNHWLYMPVLVVSVEH
jgi:hypothetical protein